ncbi:clathrin light chain isoform X2 [Culicoides brevitarsis]|uniref:clathrin light chain isoform X2 n=1 Tax=Culicoides brevitarsis TaxID=469753 RepID=UPI00307C4127
MADFEDNFEQDPAAEFLQREQSALAGLEDEIPPVANAPTENGTTTGLESSGSFEVINNVEQQDDETAAAANTNGFDGEDPCLNDDFSGFTVPKQVQEEPEKIKRWREEQKKRLEEKDAEEETKKTELREQARKELEDWYKHHEDTISKTKSTNRNAEKQFVADDDDIEPGTEWERIAKLCEFNPKTNKASKDVSRMRSIILQLKQQPLTKK